ncbi:hypothetical protein CC1G_03979 [Coprinopsis cinerea okayama7|uniref:Uncharacterized protein n=1 Tax=Coprinopsis cinerea (strain Okayama-7 / 130 / ATCC MYA-4618 / FGSC 9003) TaxID=240176 RepID=A8N8D2_COPC7|nr:hypothetical protein CC1G_03979 [Coprinopsis cinerea okayama7\|eukprot:XP_001831088.1 hypothetical protein CC1G_03979 [Coprinopsis cinerea okayama7\
MEAPLNPPVRIQAVSSVPISVKATEKHIAAFLDDFQMRSAASLGGNTAVTVQLKKLKEALYEERKSKD